MSEVVLAVTNGRVTAGHVTSFGDHFAAADPHGHVIGHFNNEWDAVRALLTRRSPKITQPAPPPAKRVT